MRVKNSKGWLNKARIALVSALCLSLLDTSNCRAQYFGLGNGLGYNGLGASLLYPLSYLFYGGSYGSSLAPMYAAGMIGSGLAYSTIFNPYRNFPYNYSNSSYPYLNPYPYYNNYSANTYPFGNYYGSGYNYNYPLNYNNYNYGQNQLPAWNSAFNQKPLSNPNQSQTPALNNNYNLNQNPPISNNHANNSSSTSLPPVAPDRHAINQNSAADIFSSNSIGSKPLDGFFNAINTRYKGNLIKALKQSDMYSWAESIGLISLGQKLPKNISKTRKDQIDRIMQDPSMESQKKIDILHILLQLH